MRDAINVVLTPVKRLWRRLLPAGLRRHAQPLVARLAERAVFAALAKPEPAFHPGPLIVSGLLSETKGVSEAARLTLVGLRAAGYAPVAHDIRETLDLGPGARGVLPTSHKGGVWLVHVNAPEAVAAMAYLDPAAWAGRKRIGYWAYELPRIPVAWARAALAFHEIWTPSRFVADAVKAAGVATPVRVMPHPAALGFAAPAMDIAARRARFGLPADAFLVVAMGDLASSATRKNLGGAIAIYKAAFPEADGRAGLVLKVQGETDLRAFQMMADQAIAGRPDIRIIAETLAGEDVRALIGAADVLLSPHRAEGFGLVPAEAFLLGVPALATGWSGNLDFMAALPDLLIGHTLVPVRDVSGVYRAPDQPWAEPDVADATAKLQRLAADPALRARLASEGQAAVQGLSGAWSLEALEGAFGGLTIGQG